jgi:molybdopterin synthase sulfur carrier subunit
VITLDLPPVLRPFAAGADHVTVDPGPDPDPTVRSVLLALDAPLRRRLIDEQGAVRRHVNLFLGQDNVRDLAGADTPLTDGDHLLILPSVAGG